MGKIMNNVRCIVGFVLLILFAQVAISAGKGILVKKSLPLDRVNGAVVKTPETSQYFPDRIIVKLTSTSGSSKSTSSFGVPAVDKFVQQYSALSVRPLFPNHSAPEGVSTSSAVQQVDLTKFYVLKYSSPIDPFKVAEELSQLPDVQYAEPWFIYPVSGATVFTPNDTLFSKQWNLARVKADSAWSVSTGDTSVVIGIVDTGVQWDHPDLAANIWTNPGETGLDSLGHDKRTNGIDDDHNGYVDDWHGWDFGGADFNFNPLIGDNDARPTADNTAHGTHVAGIAGAVTNNVTGVAGAGFNCRILAVKTSADNDTRAGAAYIIAGFEGIVYAVDMGAKIINCSWGGSGASQAEQDIVDYVVGKGAIIVAAAGNQNSTAPSYPASYNGVLSVAATNTVDQKATYSNFGSTIDVSAPGGWAISVDPTYEILSTYFPSTYAVDAGTSMASPLVAGICGLVAAHNPSYSGLQVGEQVRVTCDNIDAGNSSYIHALGQGRVNAYRALTVSSPSLRMTTLSVKDSVGGNNNGVLEQNETFTVVTNFHNYLQSTTSAATVTLTTSDTTVQILNGSFPIGAVPTAGSVNNFTNPFQVHIKSVVPPGHLVTFTLIIHDGAYNDFQSFSVLINPTFVSHDINNINVTLTNIGRIGYLDINNTYGNGFIFAGGNQLYEGGLLIGTSSTKIVDVVRNPTTQDADFSSTQIYGMSTPGTFAAQEGSAVFTDAAAAPANKIGLQVKMHSYAFTTTADSDYVLLQYNIKNTTAGTVSNLYAGLFMDWDMLPNFDQNKTSYDAGRSLGYAWDTSLANTVYAGVRALEGAASYRGLVNSVSIDLSRSGKFSWLSAGVITTDSVGDIHLVVSSGPYTIASNETKVIGFALVAGKNLTSLQTHADAAQTKWNALKPLVGVKEEKAGIPSVFALAQNYPNPFNPVTNIHYELPKSSTVTLKIFDVLGREVATILQGEQQAGRYTVPFDGSHLASGVYFYRLTATGSGSEPGRHFEEVKKLMLLR
jgi:subtilisin family serine protease